MLTEKIPLSDILNSKVEIVNGVGEKSGVFIGNLAEHLLYDYGYEVKKNKLIQFDAMLKFNENIVEKEKISPLRGKLKSGEIFNFAWCNEILMIEFDETISFYNIVPA